MGNRPKGRRSSRDRLRQLVNRVRFVEARVESQIGAVVARQDVIEKKLDKLLVAITALAFAVAPGSLDVLRKILF